MAPIQNGERRPGEKPREQDLREPASTIATGGKHAAVTAFLSHFYSSNTRGGQGDPTEPAKAVTAEGQHHAVVCAHMEQANTGVIGHQQVLPEAKGIKGRLATLAPILHWRVCTVWDWLRVYAPAVEFGEWPVAILADAYGGSEAEEINARTGCTGCPLTEKDTALEVICSMPGWAHCRPLLELKPIYRWMRKPAQRHRKPAGETLKNGSMGKNPQRMGPLTLKARATALAQILDIQRRVNVGAERAGMPGIDLINGEEEDRIRELIAARTFPNKWDGDEPTADVWLDTVYQSGAVQPILFRDLVGR